MKNTLTIVRLSLWLVIMILLKVNVLTASQIHSDALLDTVKQSLCSKVFPTKFQRNIIFQPGTYYFTVEPSDSRDTNSTDSLIIELSVYQSYRDTIYLSGCESEFPLTYGEVSFQRSVTQELSFDQDSNGCDIYHYFIVEQYPEYRNVIVQNVCSPDLPYIFNGDTLTATGVYTYNDTTVTGCDSITILDLRVHPVYNILDTITAAVCSHNLPYRVGDSAFYQTGVYDFPIHSVGGCDSAFYHLDLTVTQTTYDTLQHTLCHNEFPYQLDSVHTYAEAGTYFIEHADTVACPLVTVVILEDKPVYSDTIRATICASEAPYAFIDTLFSESVVYTHHDTTLLGCDSNLTLVLTIWESYQDTLFDTLRLCQYDIPYTFGDTVFTQAGRYVFEHQTQHGCDSTCLVMDVIVSPIPRDTVRMALCENAVPFQYGDSLIPTFGSYDLVFPDTVHFGCDTFRHLVVTSLPIFFDTLEVSVCQNTVYMVGDSALTEPGTYDIILHTINGCDSLITVTLHHYPTYYEDTLAFSVCEYDLPFVYADTSFTTPGFHEVWLQSVNGCDSIIPLQLTIWPIIYNRDTIRQEICASQLPYTAYFGRTFTAAGTYTNVTTSTITGCDSIFYYKLIVHANPTPSISGQTHLCTGTSTQLTASAGMSTYVWNNGARSQVMEIHAPNTYRVTVTDQHNCQGTATITVTEATLPNIQLSSNQTICKGESATLSVSGAHHYVWENASTQSSITVQPATTTTYHVTAYSALNCQREGSVSVTVNELPTPVITGPDEICQGASATFIASGGNSYSWSNNSTSNRITVFTDGVYTVTVTDGNNCSNSTSKTLTINELPTVTINGRTPFCQGGTTTLTASGATTYSWSTGETTPSITTAYANTYSVTGTDVHGCSSTANKTVTIWQVSAQIVGSRSFCQGGHTTLSVTGNEAYTYHWNDGSTANSLDIYTPGTYSVSVTNSLGCTNTISANVSENAAPTPSITGTTTICQGRTAILRASGGNSYIWSDGTTNAYMSATQTGTYFVTVTNAQGCSASTSETVIVNPLPEVTINSLTDICSGQQVSLYAKSATGIQYNWPMSGQQGQLITVSPSSTSLYTVMVTDENGCTNTASQTVNVRSNPTPYLSGPTSICQGQTATLTIAGGDSYLWSNGSTGNTLNATMAGMYTVTVFNTYNCSASASTTLAVNALPELTLTTDTSICQGQSVTLTALTNTGCTYLWSNGSHQNSINVSASGTYSVTATNSNGCTKTQSVNVTVHQRPQVSITGNTTFCSGSSTTLSVVSDGNNNYVWSDSTQNAPLTTSTAGTYTVTATNAYGCTQTASTTVSTLSLPNITLTGDGTICPGASATLSANAHAHYIWSTGDTTHSITVTPASTTSYSLTVTDQNGCQNSTQGTVTIGETPSVHITGNLSFCAGQQTQLIATAGYSYLWSNNAATAAITVNSSGTYKVTATNALGCTATDSVVVTTHALPTLNFGIQHTICSGQSYTYQLPGNLNYQWSTGATGNQLTVNASGIYRVTATNEFGCSTTAADSLVVIPLPTPTISGNTTICRGNSTTLTVSGGMVYQWSNGSSNRELVVSPTATTAYSVTAYNEYGCSSSTNVQVVVNSLPTISFSGDTAFCEGGSATITAQGASNFLWSTGYNTSSITVNMPGTYYVTASNAYNCSRTNSITITKLTNPIVHISGDNLVCENSSHTLTATGASTYEWSTGENTTAISIMPTATTTYSVTGTDANGCSASVSKVVNVEALPNVHISGYNTICLGESVIFTATGGATYLWSNSSTSNQITVSVPGNYSVTATSPNGCSASTSANLLVNPTPVVSISGSPTLCENSTEQLVATGGLTYQWNTGSTNNAITISTNGIYTVTASNQFGCTASTSLEVTSLAAPFIFMNHEASTCDGTPLPIQVFSTANQYQWNTGDTTLNITVTPSSTTMYRLTVTNANHCSTTDSILVTVNPTYANTFTESICQGTAYNQHGFDLPVQNVAGTFTHTLNLQSVNGCDSIITLNLTVKPKPVLPTTISGNNHITNYGTYLYDVDSTLYANSYEWRVSNTNWTLTTSNTSSAFLTINVNGSGLLTVMAINECGGVERSLSILCNVGVEEYTNESNILLYPVPTHDLLNIDMHQAVTIGQVQLYDAVGRCLRTLPVNSETMQLDCSALAPGHYFVRFLDAKGNTVDNRKIIINR